MKVKFNYLPLGLEAVLIKNGEIKVITGRTEKEVWIEISKLTGLAY